MNLHNLQFSLIATIYSICHIFVFILITYNLIYWFWYLNSWGKGGGEGGIRDWEKPIYIDSCKNF